MDYGHASLREGIMSGLGINCNGADPFIPVPTESAGFWPRALDGPGYPNMVLALLLGARLARCFT
jgi:hypothetical protein